MTMDPIDMTMKKQETPKRSIVCVDGTWFAADGPYGDRNKNITNLSRLYASIGKGPCKNSFGETYYQTKRYFEGIGAGDGIPFGERLATGVTGKPSLDQIREVYEHCCVTASQHDELWLFGFSRGAFVVRAVAGILHYIGALTSAGQDSFKKDFKLALEVYKKLQHQQQLGEGKIYHMFEAKTRPAPIIRFVGVFDTVKAVKDERLYDLSFNPSIQHMRHALALNEDRKRFEPEYIFPNFNNRTQNLGTRTFIQAWFVGGHSDMGGSSGMDGLSLYPLQWMLIEIQAHGLCLQFDGSFGDRSLLVSPLQITGLEGDAELWTCKAANGLKFEMRDIRDIHEDNVHGKRYGIRVNRARGHLWIRKHRQPFGDDEELNGYCSFGPQGTIVHPSVYLVLDKFMHVSLEAKHFPFYQTLQRWRVRVLGPKDDTFRGCFWNDSQDRVQLEGPGAVRILVCGNAAVGKSTLINKVFGSVRTKVEHRKSGRHQIYDELTAEDRSDLIIHDSNGFEAGGEEELRCVQEFLIQKSTEVDVDQRLHIIWCCVEVNSSRPKETAQYELFKTLSQYAEDVPIVIVATKKDEFTDIMYGQRKRELQGLGKPVNFDDLEHHAARELQDRLHLMYKEFQQVARFDAFVAISKDDSESIGDLSLTTSQLFTNERVRLLYIRAQVVRLDQKIDLAVAETVRVYKATWISSTILSAIPMALTTNRGAAAIDICRAVVLSFGIPTIPAETVWQIITTNLWDDMRNNARIFIAEAMATVGLAMTVLSGGLPFFLIPAAANPGLVIVATSREAAAKSISKPEKVDIEAAALAYSQHCHSVHKRVKEKLANVWKCSQKGKIETWITDIIEEFKCKVLDGVGGSLPPDFKREYATPSSSRKSTALSDGLSGSSTVGDYTKEEASG